MKLKRWAKISVIILLALVFVAVAMVVSQLPSFGAGHNESLKRGDVWNQIDQWIAGVVKSEMSAKAVRIVR